MTSTKTIEYFSYYLAILGLTVLFAPNLLFTLLFLEPVANEFVLFTGMLVLVLAIYYFLAAKSGNAQFIKASVGARGFVFVFITGGVVLGQIPFSYVLLGIVDALGAYWTWKSIKLEN